MQRNEAPDRVWVALNVAETDPEFWVDRPLPNSVEYVRADLFTAAMRSIDALRRQIEWLCGPDEPTPPATIPHPLPRSA
jgi:hypothetical protein